jgi:CRP/FNR family cyclic AMP-dependent transcriptional regulator
MDGSRHDALSRADRERLESLGTARLFEQATTIIADGSHGDHVVLIRRGSVKIVRSASAEGGSLIIGIRGRGDLVGELAVITGSPRHGSVIALENVEAVVVAGARFARLMAEDAALSLAIARTISARLAEADRYRQACGDLGVARALARLMLDLVNRYGDQVGETGWTLGVPLTQQEIADCLGVSFRTVARTLAAWRRAGLISVGRRRIVIRNLEEFGSRR